MRTKTLVTLFGGLCMVLMLLFAFFHWTVNRFYVEEGNSLMLRYKGPLLFGKRLMPKPGHWAEEGEMGVRSKLRGPGRHFYCPLWWERTMVSDVVIKPGEVGVVTCKVGEDLPSGKFLVDGKIGTTKHKGILRQVLHPGRYRINPYGYKVEVISTVSLDSGTRQAGWVEIPIGYVGVVTNMTDNPETGAVAGVQDSVLPPGIYPINGREQQVDVVEIGYRYTTIRANRLVDSSGNPMRDEAGEPLIADDDQGIEFPSSDGFDIHMDYTAIWGVMPEQAPHAIRTIGNVNSVEEKIVQPQMESICRNNGSRYKAVDLLVGSEREKFQEATLKRFRDVLAEKQISLLYGLVRHIYIPQEVRKPIQAAYLADELKLTREEEQKTARAEAEFRDSEKKVELASRTVEAETKRKVATILADEGDREAERIRAETEKLVAAIRKETAELKAQAVEIVGKAEAEGKRMIEEAKAGRFKLAVEAFGSPEAYNNWIFAQGLPEEIELKLLFAGQGTLWTDMNNFGVRANVSTQTQSP